MEARRVHGFALFAFCIHQYYHSQHRSNLIPRLLCYLAETSEDDATSNNFPFTISPLTLYRTNFPKYEAQLGSIDAFPPTTRLPAFSVLPSYNERFKHHASLYIPSESTSFHKRIPNPSHHKTPKFMTILIFQPSRRRVVKGSPSSRLQFSTFTRNGTTTGTGISIYSMKMRTSYGDARQHLWCL